MDHREVACDTYIWTEIDLDGFPRDDYINRQVRAVFRWCISIQSNLKIRKIQLRKKPCLWITGRLYVIHTYEQKLIWTDFQRMTTLIGKLEPFSGDAYQSSPNFKIRKI